MTTIRRFASALTLTCLALAVSARAQTPSIEVTTDSGAALFSARGADLSVSVQVFSPAGELVFQAAAEDGRPVRWAMKNQKGERVPDGLYRAHITTTDSAGTVRTHTETVTVNEQTRAAAAVAAAGASAPQEPLAPTGGGAAGRIAKWTSSTNLGNSIMAENSNRVAVNPISAVPTATLQVNGLQPAASSANGSTAAALLATTGGKGGNTTAAGRVGGRGAGITLTAGQGGNAVAGSTNGSGGNITIQPGRAGAGGTGGTDGNVLINPVGAGSVGIGTSKPDYGVKLYVEAGPEGSVAVYAHSADTGGTAIFGDGANGKGVVGLSYLDTGVWGISTEGSGVHASSRNGHGVFGRSTNGFAGYFEGRVYVSNNVGIGTDNPQHKLHVEGGGGTGVYGQSAGSDAVVGVSSSSAHAGVAGSHTGGGNGIYGESASGFAGYFAGKAHVSGTFTHGSDRAAKANISSIDPRSILDKLAGIPIQAWSYKTEADSIRHLGPMAQDFRAAFGLGTDDKSISTVDADGVALAAIQALYQQNQELLDEVRQLRARLARVERATRRRRAARR
jgi:hypothetical protein